MKDYSQRHTLSVAFQEAICSWVVGVCSVRRFRSIRLYRPVLPLGPCGEPSVVWVHDGLRGFEFANHLCIVPGSGNCGCELGESVGGAECWLLV